MERKIVAIGGGSNGRINADGSRSPYNTELIDKEIVRLANKEKPNFLFIGHAQPLETQESYFNCMQEIYGKIFGCNCKILKSDELYNLTKVEQLISWADIIYEGGGNTQDMICLWKETGFDSILRTA